MASTDTSLAIKIALPVLTGAIGLLSGVVLQIVKTQQETKAEKQRQMDKDEHDKEHERSVIRISFLDPLLVLTKDFREKLSLIQTMLKNPDKKPFLVKNLYDVKDRRFNNYMEFACWCNGEGHMAISTIFQTMIFFFYIGKIRFHFPFATISSHNGKKLLNVLDSIRRCFGGEYGIWATIQDAMYNFATSDDHATPIGYRTFCERFFKEEERAWVLRIIDFYYFIDKKLDHEIESMIKSLEELVSFLEELTVNSDNK